MGSKAKYIILLHILLAFFSLISVASKFAAAEEFLSFKFILYYGLALFGLAVYAFAWQQIIKHMPLITAYANRGVTVIWGIIWGSIIFSEEITVKKLIGAIIIVCGILVLVTADAKETAAASAAERVAETDNEEQ